ncbi:acyl-CoA dehydrogenase [Acinetobacter sp. 194]|uniref:acyl-CoA dehydrogenase family protein n=1 Tax=Acinetobacter shaoyimingii TaxID=2715164 RepID=UPI00140D7D22|nr:acyl-CoA dehydrogenase family protein [Acinetobacter shaoyimingii]NHB57468.1 acyl-CoA dehydrogenase [Acinetobacter shaoyimingii]
MFELSQRAQEYVSKTKAFIQNEIEPIEQAFWNQVHDLNQGADWTKWQWPAQLETLKNKAKQANLWNMFLPDPVLGQGLSVQEYAHIAELSGRSLLAPIVFNCNAPDSGNMEVLWRYGSEQQKKQWLLPLLDGKIRSVFCMTEPEVASSDATNMQATAVVEGNEIVLNGRKWWSSGLGDPNAKIIIFMAHTPDENKDRHHQHSMVLVPVDTAGVNIERMLPVFGDYDAPHGHGEISFNDVRLPIDHFIGGAGQGFEIAQGRLGPGRIHHCMRCIGAAEKSLEMMIDRGMSRQAFGKEILKLGGNLERVAEARVAIDQARLLTLYAAYKMDTLGNMAALTEISAIKVVAPNVLQQVVDMAIQIHGGAGLSRDTPLTGFFAQARALRLADGPDEVHKGMIAKLELAKRGYSSRRK